MHGGEGRYMVERGGTGWKGREESDEKGGNEVEGKEKEEDVRYEC